MAQSVALCLWLSFSIEIKVEYNFKQSWRTHSGCICFLGCLVCELKYVRNTETWIMLIMHLWPRHPFLFLAFDAIFSKIVMSPFILELMVVQRGQHANVGKKDMGLLLQGAGNDEAQKMLKNTRSVENPVLSVQYGHNERVLLVFYGISLFQSVIGSLLVFTTSAVSRNIF